MVDSLVPISNMDVVLKNCFQISFGLHKVYSNCILTCQLNGVLFVHYDGGNFSCPGKIYPSVQRCNIIVFYVKCPSGTVIKLHARQNIFHMIIACGTIHSFRIDPPVAVLHSTVGNEGIIWKTNRVNCFAIGFFSRNITVAYFSNIVKI